MTTVLRRVVITLRRLAGSQSQLSFAATVACGLCLFTAAPAPLAGQELTALQAAITMEKVIVDTIADAEKSVVAIARVRNRDRVGGPAIDPLSNDFVPNEYGTGVIVSPNGHIVTMAHVLGNIKENTYYVWHNRKPYKVEAKHVRGMDPWTDLAVIKIEAEGLQPIKYGDASKLKKGMIAIALGNPYAIARDGEVSASWGIIANLRRKAPANETTDDPAKQSETLHHFGTLIQTDARLNLGTSGGALLNLKGEMIGLTTSLAARAGYEKSAGYAVPVDDTFRRVVNDLKEKRTPQFGFLGVAPDDLTAYERTRLGRHGVVLDRVVRGTPAHNAGLQDLDIITHVDDMPIYQKSDLLRELSKQDVSTRIQLTVLRRGLGNNQQRPISLEVKLLKKYIAQSGKQPGESLWRGMRVDYATALPARILNDQAGSVDFSHSVGVVYVKHGSPAWRAGLRRGEFISQVNGQSVETPQAFDQLLRDQAGTVEITMAGFKRMRRQVEPPVVEVTTGGESD